jgi:hypothetical protein
VKVNLDKWEKISFDDIKEGDLIRAITTDDGGIEFDGRGLAEIFKVNYMDVKRWVTKSGWVVARSTEPTKTATRTFYRRKPARFKFPETTAAVISANWKRSDGGLGAEVKLVHTSIGNWVSTATGIGYTTDELLTNSENFTVLSEGVTV